MEVDKNSMRLALFGVLCALAGVLVGAGLVGSLSLSRFPCGLSFYKGYYDHFKNVSCHPKSGMLRGAYIDRLRSELNLSEDKMENVASILDKAKEEIDSLKNEMKRRINEIKEKSDNEIMNILTPEERTKFEAFKNRFKDRWFTKHWF